MGSQMLMFIQNLELYSKFIFKKLQIRIKKCLSS